MEPFWIPEAQRVGYSAKGYGCKFHPWCETSHPHHVDACVEGTPYQYILVRRDLPFNVMCVNIAHAAGESIVIAPIPGSTRLALLGVDDETQLIEYAELAAKKDFHAVLIREPDEPYSGAAMALGLEPSLRRNQLRKLFYHLDKLEITNVNK